MTMPSTTGGQIAVFLTNTARVLDLPPQLHAAADREYHNVGQFLADQSTQTDWDVYPQGSFRLGTVVRPLAGAETFDLDMVCQRNIDKTSASQAELKAQIGDALERYIDGADGEQGAPTSCEDSRRCWTLHYPIEFHMDVLPAIPDRDAGGTSILLTDKKLTRWQHSDPIAYADWFREQMKRELLEKKAVLASETRKSIEEIPDWEVKTVLQQLVQVLKVHRDLHFLDDFDDRPPSILITTLAAGAYDGGRDLFQAVLHAVAAMPSLIEHSDHGPRVMSPVADENFADKWGEYPQREAKFRAWLDRVGADLEAAASVTRLDRVVARLGESFGVEPLRKAAAMAGVETRELREAGRLTTIGGAALLSTSTAGKPVAPHGFFGAAEI
jgi:hypothetical protein